MEAVLDRARVVVVEGFAQGQGAAAVGSGREQEVEAEECRKGVEVVVLDSCPCPADVRRLGRDQDWCPGRQGARPGRRRHRPLWRRPR